MDAFNIITTNMRVVAVAGWRFGAIGVWCSQAGRWTATHLATGYEITYVYMCDEPFTRQMAARLALRAANMFIGKYGTEALYSISPATHPNPQNLLDLPPQIDLEWTSEYQAPRYAKYNELIATFVLDWLESNDPAAIALSKHI